MVKKTPGNAGDIGLIPGSGRLPGGRNGNPRQYSCLGNPTDRGAWRAEVHGVPEHGCTASLHKQERQTLLDLISSPCPSLASAHLSTPRGSLRALEPLCREPEVNLQVTHPQPPQPKATGGSLLQRQTMAGVTFTLQNPTRIRVPLTFRLKLHLC